MAEVVQEQKYRSSNPKNCRTCWIQIEFHPHTNLYYYKVFDIINDVPHNVVRNSFKASGYELETDALKQAEQAAKEYLDAFFVEHGEHSDKPLYDVRMLKDRDRYDDGDPEYVADPLANYRYPPDLTPYHRVPKAQE